ncbi:hypothetical protein F0Q45_14120 [Mycobacterium simiae]|uniref:Uncharacterized protein n=1 Tax=Mycobacterium simiae TaxID=1784 RepID=A0A5B1BQY2_MYCSI|nr:hypothetical protein [Mycobacterium simiae]KAA1249634.1 hypothetical protein F0Q45_14120 [Mycobacterium simiae]
MSGEQTHGYDLVIEFAEQAYQQILSVVFDTGGFLLGTILGGLGIHLDPATPFSVTVAFDRPGGLPAGAADVIDIHVLLGDAGALGTLRIVASVDMDTSTSGIDLARIDLEHKLWLTEITVAGFPIPGRNGLFAAFLRQNVKLIPLVPFPVDHATSVNTQMKNADVHIVDDTSPADKDASAFLVTFGGGSPGDKSAFTQSFISGGGNAGIVASMGWICRVISPMIDNSLQLGAFTNCRLTRTVRIDEDNEVDLTGLSITAGDDGALHVQVKITKSGFCYSAAGTVGAKITIAVAGGQLVVKVAADDPTVDVDIPWYCWVAGAVIGALLGALLPSVIYVIVGAVLVPLIMYIAEEVIEGTINSVAAHIADALNQLLVPVNIPAVGFNLIFSDVHIDDVQIGCRIKVVDTAPVRAAGSVVVPNGSAFDLDSGRVGARDLPSGDLAVLGGPFDRTVAAVCGARWARTGLRDFDGLFRAAVYGYAYDAPNPVTLADLAAIDPFGLLTGNPFKESLRIYAVRTNEGRWAAVQAVEVTLDHIRMRYVTWEKALATVQIVGGFTCPPSVFGNYGEVAQAGSTAFVASPVLRAGLGHVTTATGAVVTGTQHDPCREMREAVRAMASTPASVKGVDTIKEAILALPLSDRRIGTFVGPIVRQMRAQGRFDAVATGFAPDYKVNWQLDGNELTGTSGQQDLGGGAIAHYQITGTTLLLTLDTTEPVEMLLSVTVVDAAAHAASAQRCVHYEPRCTGRGRLTPVWSDYRTAWLTNFGVVEVVAPAPVIT